MTDTTREISVQARCVGDAAIIYASDYLNKLSGERIERECKRQLDSGRRTLIINFRDTELVNSIGVSILMGVIDYGLDIQQAVNAPRFHHQWEPDEIDIENVGISPDTINLLQARGHKVRQQSYWSDGECIAVDSKTGELLGAPDGRNGGKAVGY